MNQQINLLNPALLKQKVLVDVVSIALAAAVLSGVMLAYYAYTYQQSLLLNTQRNQAAIALSAIEVQLKQIALLHQPKVLNQALLDQIMQLERQEIMQQKVLYVVKQSSASAGKSYAAIMRAFARQSLDGLWLTGFSMESQTQALSISGRSLQPELVPEYIARLGDEPALQGKSFAALSMSSASARAAATSNVASAALAAATALPSPQKPYIEFVLKSNDDKPPTRLNSSKSFSKQGVQP